MNDTIAIDRVQIFASHGVLEQERRVGNLFEVSVRLHCDLEAAASTDDVRLTINYAEVVDLIRTVMMPPHNLLETVAARIRDAICDRWRSVLGGEVTVAKVHPPFSTPVGQVSVTLRW